MDWNWIADALHRISFDDLWVWAAVIAAGLTAMVAVARSLEASVDAS